MKEGYSLNSGPRVIIHYSTAPKNLRVSHCGNYRYSGQESVGMRTQVPRYFLGYSLNSSKGGYMGDYCRGYYGGY